MYHLPLYWSGLWIKASANSNKCSLNTFLLLKRVFISLALFCVACDEAPRAEPRDGGESALPPLS